MATFRLHGFVFLFVIAILASLITANINYVDKKYWQKRLEKAKEETRKSYNPVPFNVTNELNNKVHRALRDLKLNPSTRRHLLLSNDTRRPLMSRKIIDNQCLVTNPIDMCWRCQDNWHLNRKRLADCALGFGHRTTGGRDGEIYIVTDNSDDCKDPKPGTLRWGVIQKVPLWIIFDHSMDIVLTQELIFQSDKTIDGRGVNINIVNGAGITLQYVNNVIIHNIQVKNIVSRSGGLVRDSVDHIGIREVSDGDGISVFGASNIWIDHVSMANCTDGLIDVIEASTGVTISNSHFTDHNEVILLGAHDNTPKDKIMQVTVAFNHFGKRLVQRMPRVRFGFAHVVNNDYTHWMMYAIGGSSDPTIISQGNRFIAPDDINAKEITKRDDSNKFEWQKWTWTSDRDLMENGAFFVPSGDQNLHGYMIHAGENTIIHAAPGTEVAKITKFAGALDCFSGVPC